MSVDGKYKVSVAFLFAVLMVTISFAITTAVISGEASAAEIGVGKFYSVEPAGAIERLVSIDSVTAEVETVLTLSGETGFRSNSLAFSSEGELYGWDNTNKKLYKIDLSTGEVSYVSDGPETHKWVNGLSFDSEGNLYGLVGASDELLSIDTETGHITVIGPSYVDVKHNGLAVDFETDKIYSVSGWHDGKPDYLLEIFKDEPYVFSDDFSTDTTGDYTWSLHPTYPSGTGYSYKPAGYVYMDGTYSGGACCWVPAHVEAEKIADIPSSGYAKINFDLVGDGAGQSRIIFLLKENDDNYYSFKVTDDTYGSSGHTQGVTKKVGGEIVDQYNGPGTVALGGTETGNNVDAINEHVEMEVWWSPTHIRLDVNGVKIVDLQTSDTTIIDPTKFVFRSYRFNTNWNSIEILPGHVQIIGELGVDYGGVGAEFNSNTGELFTVRNSSTLMKVNLNTGEATEIGELGDDVHTVNLASPWPVACSSVVISNDGADICHSTYPDNFVPFSAVYDGGAAGCGGTEASVGIGYQYPEKYKYVTFKSDIVDISPGDTVSVTYTGWASGSTGDINVKVSLSNDDSTWHECGIAPSRDFHWDSAPDTVECASPFTASELYVKLETVTTSPALVYLRTIQVSVPDACEVVDTTPPIITPAVTGTMGNDGWYVSDVVVSWTVEDLESEITSTSGCDTTTVATDTAGTTFTCEAISAGGTASESVTVKRDATPPEVTITTPENGAEYILMESVLASWEVSDALSGIKTITATADNGDPVDTSTVGPNTFTLTATDNAGNDATVTHNYVVLSAMSLKNDAIAELEGLKTGDKKTDKKIDKAIKHIEKSLDPKLWVDEIHLDSKHGHKVFNEEKKAVKRLLKLCKCKGIVDMTLEYTGSGMVDIRAYDKDGTMIAEVLGASNGDTIFIDGSILAKGKLRSETTIKIYDSATGALLDTQKIHTSCSKPLDEGMTFGDLEVTAVNKILVPQNGVCPVNHIIEKIVQADEVLAETAIDDAKNTPVVDPKNQDKVDKEITKAEEELAKAEEKLKKGQPDKAIDHMKKAWKHAQHAIKHAQKTKGKK